MIGVWPFYIKPQTKSKQHLRTKDWRGLTTQAAPKNKIGEFPSMSVGPYDYVVRCFAHLSDAEELRDAINLGGRYDATVVSRDTADHRVVLSGRCVEGTESYMEGFVDGFYSAQALPLVRRRAQ